jgi:DNA-directed RNA polymerase subunit RPC12/RpoP
MACVMDRRTIEIQTVHERMHQRGAVTCRVCGAKVIAVKEKPWTMDGTCSKACCVTANGATSYSDVEPQLMSLISQDHDPLDLRTQNKAKVEVHCRCGKTFVVRQMYAGTMRTCGHCGTRVQVPG